MDTLRVSPGSGPSTTLLPSTAASIQNCLTSRVQALSNRFSWNPLLPLSTGLCTLYNRFSNQSVPRKLVIVSVGTLAIVLIAQAAYARLKLPSTSPRQLPTPLSVPQNTSRTLPNSQTPTETPPNALASDEGEGDEIEEHSRESGSAALPVTNAVFTGNMVESSDEGESDEGDENEVGEGDPELLESDENRELTNSKSAAPTAQNAIEDGASTAPVEPMLTSDALYALPQPPQTTAGQEELTCMGLPVLPTTPPAQAEAICSNASAIVDSPASSSSSSSSSDKAMDLPVDGTLPSLVHVTSTPQTVNNPEIQPTSTPTSSYVADLNQSTADNPLTVPVEKQALTRSEPSA